MQACRRRRQSCRCAGSTTLDGGAEGCYSAFAGRADARTTGSNRAVREKAAGIRFGLGDRLLRNEFYRNVRGDKLTGYGFSCARVPGLGTRGKPRERARNPRCDRSNRTCPWTRRRRASNDASAISLRPGRKAREWCAVDVVDSHRGFGRRVSARNRRYDRCHQRNGAATCHECRLHARARRSFAAANDLADPQICAKSAVWRGCGDPYRRAMRSTGTHAGKWISFSLS